MALNDLKIFLESSRRRRSASRFSPSRSDIFLKTSISEDLFQERSTSDPDFSDALSVMVSNLQSERIKIRSELKSQAKNNRQLTEELSNLKQHRINLPVGRAPFGEREKQKLEIIKDIKRDLDVYKATVDEAVEAMTILRQESQDRVNIMRQLEEYLSNMGKDPAQEESLREERSKLDASLNQLKNENKRLQKALFRSQEVIEEKSLEVESNKKLYQELKSKEGQDTGLKQDMADREKSFREERSKLDASLNQLKNENKKLQKEVSEARDVLEVKSQESESFKKQYHDLKSNSEKWDENIKSELEETGTSLNEIQDKLEEEKKRRQAAVQLVDELRVKVSDLEKEKIEWENTFSELDYAWALAQRKR